jgi:GT2 family glycosyltransferase
MDSVTVCMVVPTLGHRLDWLAECLTSIRLQRVDDPVLLRVVTPRPDDVAALALAHGAEVVEQRQGRLSAAINLGWAGVDADALAWLGDDDLLAPGSLAAASAALRSHPHAALVYGRVRYIDGEGRTLWLQRPGRLAARYIHVGKNLVPQQGSLFRASAVRSIGGVDEALQSAMDQDLIQRLTRVGSSVYVPAELGAFRLHGAGITETKGSAGQDEGDAVRRAHGPRWYPRVRPATRAVDRVVYAAMRRVPAPPPPLSDGVPYTQRSVA